MFENTFELVSHESIRRFASEIFQLEIPFEFLIKQFIERKRIYVFISLNFRVYMVY